MLWIYGHYKCFNSYRAGIDFGSQNLTSIDVKLWRLKSTSALKELKRRCYLIFTRLEVLITAAIHTFKSMKMNFYILCHRKVVLILTDCVIFWKYAIWRLNATRRLKGLTLNATRRPKGLTLALIISVWHSITQPFVPAGLKHVYSILLSEVYCIVSHILVTARIGARFHHLPHCKAWLRLAESRLAVGKMGFTNCMTTFIDARGNFSYAMWCFLFVFM